jgi:hypothetical protein
VTPRASTRYNRILTQESPLISQGLMLREHDSNHAVGCNGEKRCGFSILQSHERGPVARARVQIRVQLRPPPLRQKVQSILCL